MKRLTAHKLDPSKCRLEWKQFDHLLKVKATLDENRDVLPFFKTRHDLSLLISWYFPRITNPNVFAHEYPLYGDFKADLVVGDSTTHNYLLVEFENANENSIFSKNGRAVSDWSPRFESAFSQLVDWLWKLDGMRSTPDFDNDFGDRQAKFHGLIVTGKGMSLTAQEESRLKWRQDKVMVDSTHISIVSFDQLSSDLDAWLTKYHSV